MTLNTTVLRKMSGGEVKKEHEVKLERLAKLRAIEEEAQSEQRALEKEIVEESKATLIDEACTFFEKHTGVIVRNDATFHKRLEIFCDGLLHFGTRARPRGEGKHAKTLAETLLRSVR